MAGRTCACAATLDDPRSAALDKIIEEEGKKRGALIQVLHRAQKLYGYLPQEVLEKVARRLDVPLSEVFGVATFYALFSLKPRGEHVVTVCLGTACYVKGAPGIVAALEKELGITVPDTNKDGLFTVELARCLGCCGLSPVMVVDDQVYPQVTPDRVPGILRRYLPGSRTREEKVREKVEQN